MRTALWLALILAPTPAFAGVKRLAIVYGHNGGGGPRAPLRYAEQDASRVARVFVEAGQVEPGRVRLLRGRPIAELFAALEWAKHEAKQDPQTLLFVYVSTHATAEDGLLPGGEQVRWKELKRRVTATGAKARVTIVDACQSSGLIETAAKEAPSFTIEAEDRLTVQGDAFITSSAASEPSLEAGQLRGSVFTQHLVAGLRGAADVTLDGAVSLDEAYRFAYERTAGGESGQHPGWAMRLSGYGEIVVTRLGDGPGLLVPPGVERLVLRDPSSRDVVLSAVRPAAEKLLVPTGEWLVELEREGRRKEGRVSVPASGFGLVDEGQLTARAGSANLIRLAQPPAGCPAIALASPLPLLESLRQRLQPALQQVCEHRAVTAATLEKLDAAVRLVLAIEGETVVLLRPTAEQARLGDDVLGLVVKRH
ncbi:MAG: caspase family protein [Myxococcaceae bacterium]|nr:caspase family protein [Myxococcaceae bacterium]